MSKHEKVGRKGLRVHAQAYRSKEWHRKNCSVNDAGGREEPTYSSERVGVWRSRPIEAHENKQLSMAWDLTVASS